MRLGSVSARGTLGVFLQHWTHCIFSEDTGKDPSIQNVPTTQKPKG